MIESIPAFGRGRISVKKMCALLVFFLTAMLTGCAPGSAGDPSAAPTGQPADGGERMTYRQIDQETAKRMMEAEDGHVIVDVRRRDEFDAGHIPGAVLIPNESIGTERPEELPDLSQIILIYCRSGNRSKRGRSRIGRSGNSGCRYNVRRYQDSWGIAGSNCKC